MRWATAGFRPRSSKHWAGVSPRAKPADRRLSPNTVGGNSACYGIVVCPLLLPITPPITPLLYYFVLPRQQPVLACRRPLALHQWVTMLNPVIELLKAGDVREP